MCGITAVVGDNALFRAMNITLAQTTRGNKSAGTAYIDNNNKLVINKLPDNPVKLALMNDYFKNTESKIAICHNRSPSIGKVSLENTHPFFDCKNRFAMIHNGTIEWYPRWIQTLKDKGHKILGDTDSEILAHSLCLLLDEGKGMKEAIAELINEILVYGATLIVLESNGDIWATKNFITLNYCVINNEKYNYVVLASEKEAIQSGMYGIIKDEDIKELDYGSLVHIKPDHTVTIEDIKKLKKNKETVQSKEDNADVVIENEVKKSVMRLFHPMLDDKTKTENNEYNKLIDKCNNREDYNKFTEIPDYNSKVDDVVRFDLRWNDTTKDYILTGTGIHFQSVGLYYEWKESLKNIKPTNKPELKAWIRGY